MWSIPQSRQSTSFAPAMAWKFPVPVSIGTPADHAAPVFLGGGYFSSDGKETGPVGENTSNFKELYLNP
jgi:hypothetical protein